MNIASVGNDAANPLQTAQANQPQQNQQTTNHAAQTAAAEPQREVNRTSGGDTYTPTASAGSQPQQATTGGDALPTGEGALPAPPQPTESGITRESGLEVQQDLVSQDRSQRLVQEATNQDQLQASRNAREGTQTNNALNVTA